ncbi:Hypothetical predicted protein [Pelobates cultripes]|uniref:Laminin G domain-containing protein n=3 Tax=Pelobates cultripes TaxID=61616 RepID=A0AAD1VVS0_PELCU|nr:Hypothetical predicted protein [Pelobates cultripes]
MAGRHWLVLLLSLGGVLQDMATQGQHDTGDSWSQGSLDVRLEITFTTTRSSGLLFLASGENQYLIVELVNGTLRARLEVGSGESILNSNRNLTLHNSEEHKLELVVEKSKMVLIVDNLSISIDLPSHSKELNWKHGLYLGGGGNTDLSNIQGNLPTFHGCILEATFNRINLLSSSHPLVQRHGQWEDCQLNPAPTFVGSLGFLGPRSYLIFPRWDFIGSLQLTMVTSRAGRAPLLYQSGPRSSYIYVEIVGGYLQVTIQQGENVAQIQNPVYISDGHLHRIQILLDSSEVKLGVDKTFSELPISDLGTDFDFHGNLYLGGVDETILAKMREGLVDDSYVDDMEYRSFIGCLKDFTVNSVKRGLRDAVVIKDVTDGCQDYEYYDYNEYDDTTTPVLSTTIIPQNTTMFLETPSIISSHDKCKPDPSFPNLTSLVNPQPLPVTKGGSTILLWQHINPTVDLGKFGIRPSQVILSLVGSAQHGHLELEMPGAETRKKFTLLDVSNHKVSYVHDGSHSYEDKIILEVSVTSGVKLPECLSKMQRHILPINVLAAVAMPNLQFPKVKKLGVLSHGAVTLTTKLIEITDSESLCEQLTIFVSVDTREGQVELKHRPGEAIHQFPCTDLKNGQVVFIHKSGNHAQLTIEAIDKISKSYSANLTFYALEPQNTKIRDAELIVIPGASALITPSNVPTFTSADNLGDEIMYQLTKYPKLGEIQRLTDGRQWKTSQVFRQSELESSRVRYFSKVADFHGEDLSEDLTMEIKLWSQVVSNKTLQVRMKKPSIQIMRMIPLRIGRRREIRLTNMELQVDSMAMDLNSLPVTYTILQSPRKGNLQLIGQRLTEGSHFTQRDLENGHITYAATVRNTIEMEDQFQFQVMLGAQISPVNTYKIHIDVDPDAPLLTNQLLHVLEGGEVAITPEHLFLKSGNSANFLYEVIDGPQYGKLIRKGHQVEVGIEEFTNDDIITGKLFYEHDGSETTEDDIPFVASRQKEGSATDTSGEEEEDDDEEEVVRGVFRVSIQLVNDNPPVQVVQKTFHVVRDGQRLLTTNDIAFLDPDVGTTDAQLVLVRYGVPFGRIVFVDDPSLLVFRFTQEDLRMHRILYVHNGPDQGSIQLQVSDGLYHLTTVLEVQASDPFIHIANVTLLNVPSGGQGTLSPTSFTLETNLDIRNADEIRYHIMPQPRWGHIFKGGKAADSFSQLDLTSGLVVYQHGGERSKKDYFRISVEANQVVAYGDVEIQVGTETPAVVLKVIHNEKVYVFQGEPAEIKKEYLMVSAEDTFPHKIIYTLTDPPASGYLVAVSDEPSSDGSASLDSVHTFTQEDINQGRILYLHSASEMNPDSMTLDVTVGTEAPREIVVFVEVLPFYIPLDVAELRVKEGDTATITTSILRVSNEYFLDLQLEFIILGAPSSGRIISTDKKERRAFSWNEIPEQIMLYHWVRPCLKLMLKTRPQVYLNGPDSLLLYMLKLDRPHSLSPVSRPSGPEVLEDDTADISTQVLQTVDADSLPEDVVYSIHSPTNGQVILKTTRGRVQSFSQKQVDQGLVKFKHKGVLDGGFFFVVSDGKHETEQHFFRIQVIPISITMKTINSLDACPRSFQPITRQHLTAVTNEKKGPPPALIYHIDEPPLIGQIRRLENSEEVIANFTQSDVDAGLIYYKHVTDNSPFWTAQDYFAFHVTSQRAATQRYRLNVTVSFQNPCPQLQTRLWKNTGLTVLGGGSSPIDHTILDASNLLANPSVSSLSHDVVFLLTRLPTQGHLSIKGSIINPQNPHFLQSHLDEGSLIYTHKGSGIQGDSFQFKAWLWPKLKSFHEPPLEGDSAALTENLNITIISVPKLPPVMSPPTSPLIVVPGSYAALNTNHLSLLNIHSSSKKIIYSILELPVGISLANREHITVPISSFTQEDLSNQQVIIKANYTAISGSIQFNVTTEHQPPGIALLPIKVPTVFKTVLEVPQATGRSVLTIDHVPPTVGIEQEVLYNVTKQPIHGHLVAGNVPVSEFRWKQVKDGKVSYAFTSFQSSKDEFRFLAISPGGDEVAGMAAITVSPMVKLGDKEQWPRACTVKLGIETVDAGELATYTASVPEFRVLRQPRGGRLVRISQDGKDTIADSFTQTELERGFIGVELWDDGQSSTDIRSDRIHMELSANQVPPANITVKFNTVPYNSSNAYSVNLLRVNKNLETTTNSQEMSTTTLESTSYVVTTHLEPEIRLEQTTHSEPTSSLPSTSHLEVTTSLESVTHLQPTTTFQPKKGLKPTDLESTTHLEPTTNLGTTIHLETTASTQLTTHLESITTLVSSTSLLYTPTLVNVTESTSTSFHFSTLASNLSDLEDITVNTTQDLPSHSSWTIDVSTSFAPVGNNTALGFTSAHVYNIIIPICLVLILVAIGLLLLVYLLRKKKMGMHHVQKAATSSAKPENGTNDRQTFRPTEPDRVIPLCEVGAEHRSNGARQAPLGSQYWV